MGKGAQLVQQTLKRVLEVERTVAAVAYASSESVAADQQPEPGEEEERLWSPRWRTPRSEPRARGLVGDGVEAGELLDRAVVYQPRRVYPRRRTRAERADRAALLAGPRGRNDGLGVS